MYGKMNRQLFDNQRYTGNITGVLVTYSGMLGTQEFMGTGNPVNEGQTRPTDESQMMMSCWGCTSELHK